MWSEFLIDLYEEDPEALIIHFRQFLTKRNRADLDLETFQNLLTEK
jgi:hypothetical protein